MRDLHNIPAYDETPSLVVTPDDRVAEIPQGFTYGNFLYGLVQCCVTTDTELHDYTLSLWSQIQRQLTWHTKNSIGKSPVVGYPLSAVTAISFVFRNDSWDVVPHVGGNLDDWAEDCRVSVGHFVATFQKLL